MLTLSRRIGAETCDLLDKLLTCNPRERLTASQALDHDYFWTDPLPADPKTWAPALLLILFSFRSELLLTCVFSGCSSLLLIPGFAWFRFQSSNIRTFS